MNCPFCKEQFSSQDDLQLHCLSCTSAFAEPRTSRTEACSSVVVRFRWVKSRPCLDREIHLITSLAGSVTLYWKLDEALYESDTVDVPVGEHICQLALDGDVVPTEPFVVSEDSDVIFVIVRKAHYRYTSFDESYDRGRISDEARCDDVPSVPGSTSTSDRQQPHLGMDSRHGDNESALSPLYKELLQHQLSHGEPSWVPGSGMQSPVMSDTDLSDLARQEEEEPSVLNLLPGQSEEHLPRPAEEGRPVDLSGESDGSLSFSDGRGVNEQSVSDNETEEAILRSSFSILASGHTRNSPPHSLASDGSGRDVVSPLVVEAAMPQNLSAITGDHCGEEHVTAPLSSSLQPTYSRGPVFIRATNHLPNFTNESPAERIQSTSRVSPVGSVLDAVTVSTTTEAGVLENDNTTTTSTVQRHSPSASVHSSSLFSSGLPSPIMSPRGRSQSDTRVPLVFRENPPGSLPTYPVRPQSQSGFILASAAGLVSTLDGVTAHSLLSSNSPAERESPSGSAHSTSVVPQGRTDAINSYQQNDASTAVLAEVADPLDGQFFSDFGHQPKDSDTGNPTELLVEKPTMPVSSLAQPTGCTPLELSLAGYEESGISTLSASRYSRGPTDIHAESNYRQGVVASRDSGNDTYPVHSPRHTTSGALSPSQLLSEAPLTLLPSTCARLDHQESQSATSTARTPEQHIAFGPESSSETQPVVLHSGLSKESRGSENSGIPSNRSAFSAVTGDRDSSVGNLPSQMEVLIQERDSLASELRQRAARYEADLIRLRTRNDDLQQQLLSIETVAALTKQDNEKTKAVEQTLREKDQQISALQESMAELEKNNGRLKDEQESLKTVNELRLEDVNRLNSDLQQQLSVLRRRLVESSPAQRSRNEAKIIELQVEKNTLEQRVMRLVQDNENLREQLKQAQREKGSVKARTRISKAKSETDLSRKFDKYPTYDEQNYRDPEPVAKAVTFGTRTDTSGLRTSRYSLLDAKNSRSYDLSSPVALNGYGSHPKRRTLSSNSTVKDILAREPVSGKVVAPRHRQGSLGEDSDASDDFEHANHPRWRHTQRSVPLLSSGVSWDPVASVYEPYDRGMERRSRPHSYHGGSVHDLYSGKGDNLSTSPLHEMTSRYSKRNDDRHSSSSSNYSTTDSSLLTTTSYKSSYHKLSTKPFAPRSSSDIKLGMEVLVTRSRGQIARGKVKYVGPLPGRHETYIGIELGPGQAEGKHDGSCHGQRLFTCKPNRGIFVPFGKVVMCYG